MSGYEATCALGIRTTRHGRIFTCGGTLPVMSFASEQQHDILMLAIERLARAVRQLVTGRGEGQSEEQDQENDGDLARETEETLAREFGSMHVHLKKVDPASVAGLLKPLSRLRAYSSLLACRAVFAARRGENVTEQATRALALLLQTIACERALPEQPVHPTDPGLVAKILELADVHSLEPSSRTLLQQLAAAQTPVLQANPQT